MKRPKLEILSKSEIIDIDAASRRVLEEVGLMVNHDKAREMFKKAGCEVDEKTKVVKIPSSLVTEAMSSTPTNYRYYSRDGKHDVTLSGDGSKTLFAPLGIATNVTEYVSPGVFKKRASTLQDIKNLSTLVDACENIDHMIQGISAMDLMTVSDKNRRVREFDALLTGTSKPFMWDSDYRYNEDCFKIEAACYSGDEEEARKKPFYMNVSCTTSPLQLDYALCDLCITSADFNVPMMVMTMGMCGTSAPIHIAGTLVENNAEVLGGLVLSQLANKGAPNLYGSCTTSFDFYCNSAPWGTPEGSLISACVAQLANFYGVPSIVMGSASDSKMPDIQSGHEVTMNMMLPTLCGAGNLTGAGMIELGMSHSFEQLIVDNDLYGVMNRIMEGVEVTKETMMVDEIIEVGPFGDYVAHPTTIQNFGMVNHSQVLDHNMYDEWVSGGSKSALDLAHERVVDILANHKVEPIDNGTRKAIDAIIKEADAKYKE